MKLKSLYLICVFILLISSTAETQTLTQEEKEELINSLSITELDSMFTMHYAPNAIQGIIEYIVEDSVDFQEAIPAIMEHIWKVSPFDQTEFLWALFLLNAPQTEQLSLSFIDSVDHYENIQFTKLSLKIRATHILFKLGNYSKYHYVFDELSQEIPEISSYLITMLRDIILNVPSEEIRAKNALMNIAEEESEDIYRYYALSDLAEHYGDEMIQFFAERFVQDEDIAVVILLYRTLAPYKDEVINSAFKTKLPSITEALTRNQILTKILFKYGAISDYSYVLDYQNSGIDPQNETFINAMLIRYIPPKPELSTSVLDMLDDLINLTDTVKNYTWLGDLQFKDDLQTILQSAKTNLLSGDSLACRVDVKSFQDSVDNVYKDSLNADPRFVTIEGWKFLYWNAQYILDRLPEPPASPNLLVSLTNSQGTQIPASLVKYYDAGWKDAIDNGDGTFTVITERSTVSLRMTYEYGKQTVHNVPAQDTTYTFQTVNAAVELRNSLGNLIDEGTVKYYAGAWRSFGTTVNGIANKELLPKNYSFRMTYEYGSIDKQQNLSTDPTVVFQTVNAALELRNSLGNLIDEGIVQYYAGAWRSFGTTVNGIANKELLPKNYSFRMSYEYVSNDKQQDLSTNSTVIFSTVLCTVKVSDTNNQPLENAEVKNYSGAWRDIGLTNTSGIVTKELLPKTLSFRAIYGSVSEDKQQDIGINNLVEFILNIP